MAADILTTLATWSTTEGSNQPIGSTAISTNLDDNLRMIQSVVRYTMASDTIASATTTDLGTKESQYLTVSGVTTITGLGTISAGITKYVTFSGALILTHNATSLILPGAANITTAAGDTARFLSLGSGNWRCLSYTKATGYAINASPQFLDGTVSLPGITWASDLNTGLYRIGADSMGFTAAGVKVAEMSAANGLVSAAAISLGLGGLFAITSTGALTVNTPSTKQINFNTVGASFRVNEATESTAGAVDIRAGYGNNFTLQGGNQVGSNDCGNVLINGGNTDGVAAATGGRIIFTSGYSLTRGHDIEFVLKDGSSDGSDFSIQRDDGGTFYKFVGLKKHIHVVDSGNTPTITSGGGTSPTITGTDNAFQITVGTGGSASTIKITFNKTWANAPMVIASHQGAVLPLRCAATTSVVDITASTAFTAGGIIDVFCIGRE